MVGDADHPKPYPPVLHRSEQVARRRRGMLIRLGFSRIADYARERLGVPASTALAWMQLARELRDRPVLRRAVRAGMVSPRKVLVVSRVAVDADEAAWTAAAAALTEKELRRRVEEGGGSVPEEWNVETLQLRMLRAQQDRLDLGIAVAREALEDGRLTYTKALLVAKGASVFDVDLWIERASSTTAQQTAREAEASEEAQNRRAGRRRIWGEADGMETIRLGIACARALPRSGSRRGTTTCGGSGRAARDTSARRGCGTSWEEVSPPGKPRESQSFARRDSRHRKQPAANRGQARRSVAG